MNAPPVWVRRHDRKNLRNPPLQSLRRDRFCVILPRRLSGLRIFTSLQSFAAFKILCLDAIPARNPRMIPIFSRSFASIRGLFGLSLSA
jgi:hypothetical protein